MSDLGRACRARQADRRPARPAGDAERGRRSDAVHRERAPARPRSSAARRRRRLAPHGLVLLFLSPWLVGFSVFFLYPMVATPLLVVHPLRPAAAAALGRARELPYLLHEDTQFWPAVRNTLWLVVIGVPLQVLFAFGVAVMLRARGAGIGSSARIFYLPALAPPVAATLGFVYLLNPATGPVNQVLGTVGIDGPLWFHDPRWAKPALDAARACGASATR